MESTEFTEYFDQLNLPILNDNFVGVDSVKRHFKDWVRPKPLIKVPTDTYDWLNSGTLYDLLQDYYKTLDPSPKSMRWIEDNRVKISRSTSITDAIAYLKLNGYEREDEPKYFVRIGCQYMLFVNTAGSDNDRNNFANYRFSEVPSDLDMSWFSKLTEGEIKKLNPDLWPFAVREG